MRASVTAVPAVEPSAAVTDAVVSTSPNMTVIGRDAEYGERLRTYITTSEPPELNDADGLTDSTIDFVQS